ncbi:MAG TPA: DUF1802 family protein [Nitrososphaeraceae archaeon]|jgi:hypothetical protein|nr:DUF1802 family protein [Nitrososphaeraceae archaeon]
MLALKEWNIVCKALEWGNQSILLRKGGILEYREGFEISQKIFLLYPTLEHQSKKYLQPSYLQEFELLLKRNDSDMVQDKSNTIRILARIEAMQEFHDETLLSKLEKYHIWNEKYVNMRMSYNPKKPMNALLLRVYKLPEPISINVNPQWAGCKSWIDIDLTKKYGNSYDTIYELLNQCEPVIKDNDFQQIYDNFMEIWN